MNTQENEILNQESESHYISLLSEMKDLHSDLRKVQEELKDYQEDLANFEEKKSDLEDEDEDDEVQSELKKVQEKLANFEEKIRDLEDDEYALQLDLDEKLEEVFTWKSSAEWNKTYFFDRPNEIKKLIKDIEETGAFTFESKPVYDAIFVNTRGRGDFEYVTMADSIDIHFMNEVSDKENDTHRYEYAGDVVERLKERLADHDYDSEFQKEELLLELEEAKKYDKKDILETSNGLEFICEGGYTTEFCYDNKIYTIKYDGICESDFQLNS